MPVSSQPFDALPDLKDPSLHGAWLSRGVQGGARDYSADGNDMVIGGGSPVFERVGARFDGAADYLRRAVADWRNTDTQGTITAWIKKSALTATGHAIFGSGDEASGKRLILQISDTNLMSFYIQGTATNYIEGSTTIQTDRWYRIAIVSNGSQYFFYVDGQAETLNIPVGSNDGAWLSSVSGRDNITIGVLVSLVATERYFEGIIKDVRYHSEPKSADWIKYDFQRGVPDSSLLLHILDGQRDLSRRRVSITVSADCIIGHEMIFTNGGITWAAQAIISYGYWYRGAAPDFWRYYFWDGVRKYVNGEFAAGAMPVAISATGFAGVTGTMKDIKTYSN